MMSEDTDPTGDIPAGFVELDPEKVWELIEGEVNVIAPAVEEASRFFKTLSCPVLRCGGGVLPQLRDIPLGGGPGSLFTERSPIPNYIAKCKKCGCVFEPHTQLIVSMPKEDY